MPTTLPVRNLFELAKDPMFYPLAASTWDSEEIAAGCRVLETGMTTMGEHVRSFERDFAAKFGARHAIMVNSGSSANLVAIAALCFRKERPLQRGDEIIVPAVSWATTYAPLQQYGLKLRFVDVDLDTLNVSAERVAAAITPRTRAVMAVSILGNPAPLDELRALCDARGLYLVEDNCESMGATLAGRSTGTFGHVNTFSLFFSHHISTMEGGMVLTDDDELHQLCLCLRNHGWTRDQPADSQLFEKRDDDFFEAYRFILPGYNLRPTEISGAIGVVQLKKLDRLVLQRRANATYLDELFADDARLLRQREHGQSSWFAFTFILNPQLDLDRSRVMAALKEAGIGYRIITGGCMLRHDMMRFYDYDCAEPIVNANMAHDRGFFVGNHPFDLRPQLDRLRDVLDTATR